MRTIKIRDSPEGSSYITSFAIWWLKIMFIIPRSDILKDIKPELSKIHDYWFYFNTISDIFCSNEIA